VASEKQEREKVKKEERGQEPSKKRKERAIEESTVREN